MARPLAHPHTLERRSELLARAAKHRVAVIQQAVTPAGQRPPFTRKQTALETLRFWAEHRYDQTGRDILQGLPPQQIAALDAWLAEALGHPDAQQVTAQRPQPLQGGEEILNRALGAEQRLQGPALSPEVS